MAKEITTANFETEVLKSEKPVLIDFWATWCGPCMRQGPVVEELAEEGYAVGKVDVDQNMALAQQFRVVSIPTLILFKDGAEVKRFVGLTSKEELKSALEGLRFMKILLVACNAKYIHSNLAVYDLQAYASDYADHIVLKEYTINQQKDDIMRDIYLEHPDVVCVSCYIWNLSFVKELMADLIKILPGADFWAGGPEVSYDAEKFLTENS